MRVLMVCLGNICRSPMAEGILVTRARQRGFSLEVDSAGTGNWHVGQAPDHRTLKVAADFGVIIHHVGRQIRLADFEDFDQILVMDDQNHTQVLALAGPHAAKVKKMRHYDPQGPELDVPDPYYGTEQDFREVYDILDRSIENFLNIHSGQLQQKL